MVGPSTRRDLIAQATKVRPPEIALRGLTRPLGVHPPARPLWRQYWHANCVCQSQRLGSGTSRTFFSASARPIAFLAAVTASDLFAAWPMITTPATDAVHFRRRARCLERRYIRCARRKPMMDRGSRERGLLGCWHEPF